MIRRFIKDLTIVNETDLSGSATNNQQYSRSGMVYCIMRSGDGSDGGDDDDKIYPFFNFNIRNVHYYGNMGNINGGGGLIQGNIKGKIRYCWLHI